LPIEELGREGIDACDSTACRASHEAHQSLKAAPVRPVVVLADRAAGKKGLVSGLSGRRRITVIYSDTAITTQTPSLRACWAKVGQQAGMAITGNRAN
jgi:hypothetical protein